MTSNDIPLIFERIRDKGQVNLLDIAEMSAISHFERYYDSYPLLELRLLIIKSILTIKVVCKCIVKNPMFEALSLAIIFLNSITLAYEDPNDDDMSFLDVIESYFIFIYTFEMVMKIIGCGLIFDKGAYLRDSWNILDFIIVIASWISKENKSI